MSDLIITERIGHVTRLTLNSPASLNALSDAMLAALTSALGALADDRATRVIILRGTGKAFCAGHDLKEMQAARQTLETAQHAFSHEFVCTLLALGLEELLRKRHLTPSTPLERGRRVTKMLELADHVAIRD